MINKCRVNNYEYAAIEVEKRLKEVESELSRLPQVKESDVRINVREIGGKPRFFAHYPGESRKQKYLKPGELDEIPEIIRNDYFKSIKRNLEKEYRMLRQLKTFYGKSPIDHLYMSKPQGKRSFINPIRVPTDELLKRFESVKQNSKPFKENDTQLKTMRGERVRSKNELLIANELYHRGIPYLYEPEIKLMDGSIVHPDFVIFNLRTREILFWEHFGKMNDSYYVEYAVNKIHRYLKNGFTNKNFITTFEYDSNGYLTDEINRIITTMLM